MLYIWKTSYKSIDTYTNWMLLAFSKAFPGKYLMLFMLSPLQNSNKTNLAYNLPTNYNRNNLRKLLSMQKAVCIITVTSLMCKVELTHTPGDSRRTGCQAPILCHFSSVIYKTSMIVVSFLYRYISMYNVLQKQVK